MTDVQSQQHQQDDVKVVLEQTLLNCPEVFVYRIPPMMTSGGHRADDWNLAEPIETCSLQVKRVDSSLHINLMSERPKPSGPPGATEPHLFAMCKIQLDFDDQSKKMEHWVESVVDSSRYSVIRISDERTGREAHIGMGFRERGDAVNFKMSLQEYESALRRERKAEAIHMAYERTHPDDLHGGDESGGGAAHGGGGGEGSHGQSTASHLPPVGNLTLKEGEKIHVKLKGVSPKPRRDHSGYGLSGRQPAVGKGGLLLKKPPPADVDSHHEQSVIIAGAEKLRAEAGTCIPDAESSIAAVADSDVEDDEWGDFESST